MATTKKTTAKKAATTTEKASSPASAPITKWKPAGELLENMVRCVKLWTGCSFNHPRRDEATSALFEAVAAEFARIDAKRAK